MKNQSLTNNPITVSNLLQFINTREHLGKHSSQHMQLTLKLNQRPVSTIFALTVLTVIRKQLTILSQEHE